MVSGRNLANSGAGEFTPNLALNAGHASELVRTGPARLRTAGGGAVVIISPITGQAPSAANHLSRRQGRGDPFAGKIGHWLLADREQADQQVIVDDLACFKGVLLLSRGRSRAGRSACSRA